MQAVQEGKRSHFVNLKVHDDLWSSRTVKYKVNTSLCRSVTIHGETTDRNVDVNCGIEGLKQRMLWPLHSRGVWSYEQWITPWSLSTKKGQLLSEPRTIITKSRKYSIFAPRKTVSRLVYSSVTRKPCYMMSPNSFPMLTSLPKELHPRSHNVRQSILEINTQKQEKTC